MSQIEQEQEGSVTTAASGSLLDEIVEASQLKCINNSCDLTKKGLLAFIEHLASKSGWQRISEVLVDEMIAQLDASLTAQVNEILHNQKVQEMESAWRSMKYLVDNTDFRQNIKVEFISISKSDLLDDFEDAPEVVTSGLYKHVYTAEYGQFGGKPVGAIIANYEFGPKPQDISLLQYVASVSAMAHAPFIAAADKDFFGIDSWDQLPNLKDLHSIFDMPQYAKWRSFRESEDARYVGLTLPKFLLRLPYGEDTVPAKNFTFKEHTEVDEDFCWANASFAFATRLTDSFAKYRWCTNIIGPQGGGTVENLPLYQFEIMGQVETKIPTQVLISERREFELAEEGFIALTMRKGSNNAAFFSATSCLKPRVFTNTPKGKESQMNFKLSTQLPYMMIMNRLAHYIKVIQRENIGSWKECGDLNRELNKWISQYVTEMDTPDPTTRSKRPLRMAKITVSEVENDPGWYSVSLVARPHFKYMGASFTLSLVGKLDKK